MDGVRTRATMRLSLAVVCLSLVGMALAGFAPQRVQAMGLDEAISMAQSHRPALVQAQAGQAVAEAQLKARQAARLPRLGLALGWVRLDDPAQSLFAKLSQSTIAAANFTPPEALNDPGPLTDLSATLTLQQAVYAGGRIQAGVQAGEAGRGQATAMLAAAQNEARKVVSVAFYRVLLARDALQVAQRSEQIASNHLGLVNDQFQAGTVTKAALRAAEAHLAHVRGQRIERERDLALARVALTTELGVENLSSEPVGELPLKASTTADIDTLLTRALNHRPVLASASSGVQMADARHRIARGAYLPEVGLQAAASDHRESPLGDAGQQWQLAAQLKWNLFAGGGNRAGAAAAGGELARAKAARDGVRLMVRSQVTQADLSRRAAIARMQVAAAEVVAAEEGIKLVQDRFDAGAALQTDLEDADERLSQAQLGLLKARHDLAVAEVTLRWAVGGQIGGS